MSNNLQDRWIHILEGEYSLCGQIAMAVGSNHILIKHVGAELTSYELRSLEQLCSDPNGERYVSIFDTEAELDAWLAWMSDDNKPRIVRMPTRE